MEKQRIRLDNGVSIFREGLTWLADYTLEGKRVVKSLKTRDLAEAVVGGKLIRIHPDDIWNLVKVCREKIKAHELANQLQELNARRTPAPGTAEPIACKAVLDEKLKAVGTKNRAPSYLTNFRRQVDWFIEHFKDELKTVDGQTLKALTNINDVAPDHIIEYLHHTRRPKAEGGDGLGEKSVKDRADFLKSWLDLAVERGYIKKNPAAGLGPDEVPRPDIDFFSAAEVKEILEAAKDPQLAAAIALSIYAGPRREEIFLLEPKDVSLNGRTIRIHNRDGKPTKTGKSRTVFILDQLLPYLKVLNLSEGRVITRWESVWGLGEAVLDHVEAVTGNRRGLQTGRHSFVTWALLWVSESVVADLIGDTPATVERSYRGLIPHGSPPLRMTFYKRPLERHGVTWPKNP